MTKHERGDLLRCRGASVKRPPCVFDCTSKATASRGKQRAFYALHICSQALHGSDPTPASIRHSFVIRHSVIRHFQLTNSRRVGGLRMKHTDLSTDFPTMACLKRC